MGCFLLFYVLVLKFFVLFAPYVRFHILGMLDNRMAADWVIPAH